MIFWFSIKVKKQLNCWKIECSTMERLALNEHREKASKKTMAIDDVWVDVEVSQFQQDEQILQTNQL